MNQYNRIYKLNIMNSKTVFINVLKSAVIFVKVCHFICRILHFYRFLPLKR